MQSRNFILAIVLMIATVVIVNALFPPVRRPVTTSPDTTRAVSPAQPQAPQPSSPPTAIPAPAPTTATVDVVVDTIVVQSELFRYGISTQGAALVSAELLKYESQTRPGPVQLAPTTQRGLVSYRFRADGQTLDLASITFTADRTSDLIFTPGVSTGSVKLTGTDATTGRTVEVTYAFRPDDYVIDVVARMSNAGR